MLAVLERHNPSWVLWPVNNNRTAGLPIGLPLILVEPHRYAPDGTPLSNSQVLAVRVLVEETPRRAIVAGPDHIGLLVPDHELYIQHVSRAELSERAIDLSGVRFFTDTGAEIQRAEAVDGDLFQYTTASGVRETTQYLSGACYYDLSDIKIDPSGLPTANYYLSYQADYYVRITSKTSPDRLMCIDVSRQATAVFRLQIQHPGLLYEDLIRLTPDPFSAEQYLAFCRPFTDALQDVYDEQSLLGQINWVDNVAPEFIPYLAHLLGLDIPFFPHSLDRLRRTMLRNVVRLQQLKGSKQAFRELFELFGFIINFVNLFWAEDGSRLIRPGERLPEAYAPQAIPILAVTQFEPLLASYDTDGFGQLTIPLLFRPTQVVYYEEVASLTRGETIVLDAYLVGKETAVCAQLGAIVEACGANPRNSGPVALPATTTDGILGFSRVVLDLSNNRSSLSAQAGQHPPLTAAGSSYDPRHNIVQLTFNGAILFSEPNRFEAALSPGLELFCFATYERHELQLTDAQRELQSNRFDVQILSRAGEQLAPDVLEFLVDFLFKLKAFHSLLNAIVFTQELRETYEVTDFCVGGDIEQRYDMDAGRLQVPPAIAPTFPQEGDCNLSPQDLGYKTEDIQLRERKLVDLQDEHAAWAVLDRESDTNGCRLAGLVPQDRADCLYTQHGQDRIVIAVETTTRSSVVGPGPTSSQAGAGVRSQPHASPVDESQSGAFVTTGPTVSSHHDSSEFVTLRADISLKPQTHCTLDGVTDYCYRGRAQDELLHAPIWPFSETYHNRNCALGLGFGLYYLLPSPGTYESGADGAVGKSTDNFRARLARAFDRPSPRALHYCDKPYLDAHSGDPRYYLAFQRPQLGIELPFLHFPGCRYPTLGALSNDFEHPVWRAKPWDDLHSNYCGSAICYQPDLLHATLAEGTNGNHILVYDDEPYRVLGNAVIPDQTNLEDPTIPPNQTFATEDVVHSVFSSADHGLPAVSLEATERCEQESSYSTAEGMITADGYITIARPRFSSAGQCGTGYVDFCDGYASSTGLLMLTWQDLDRNGITFEVPATSTFYLFSLNSGIRLGSGFRLDCGCLLNSCGSGGTSGNVYQLPCVGNEPPDQADCEANLLCPESLDCCSLLLDGSIPSLAELQ